MNGTKLYNTLLRKVDQDDFNVWKPKPCNILTIPHEKYIG